MKKGQGLINGRKETKRKGHFPRGTGLRVPEDMERSKRKKVTTVFCFIATVFEFFLIHTLYLI